MQVSYIRESVKAARLFLAALCPTAEVSIWLWHDVADMDVPEHVGVRVAEVSFVSINELGNMAGSSYMQSDPDGLAVCAAVERLIIAYLENEDMDLAEDLVRHCIGGK